MKILADENIPLRTVKELREMGYDVLDIRRTPDEGMKDAQLWELAQAEERLLITTDKGFAGHRNEPHHGILIIRLRQPNRRKIHQHIIQAITQDEGRQWSGLLVVMRDFAQSTWRARQVE